MADNPKIRGKNVSERTASIEQALKSLTRRAVKRAVVYVQPVPIFMNCAVVPTDKVIGKVIIPFSGTIKEVFIAIGDLVSEEVVITIEIGTLNASHQTHFTLSKRSEKLELLRGVEAGSIMRILLEEGDLTDILIAVAVYPEIEDHKAQQYLLDEILKDEEPGNALQDQEN